MVMDRGFEDRIVAVSEFLDALFASDFEDAVVADGWPRAMVRAGFALHRKTWNAERLAAALLAELELVDSYVLPESVTHIWPALPGAGLTPVLFGWLLGVRQKIRVSSRGQNFGALVGTLVGPISGLEMTREIAGSEVVVVSGSDETLAAVRAQLSDEQRLVGYGHRTSFGVVVDSPALDLERVAEGFARDAVMWHQKGCFSARGVVFVGESARKIAFAGALGNAIEDVEQLFEATHLDEKTLGRRAQALGLAKFASPVCGRGIGWVQPQTTPYVGAQISPHVVTLHWIDDVSELGAAVQVPVNQVQGVALGIAEGDARRDSVLEMIGELGATLVCEPGDLQGPPAEWAHDGRPNVLEWFATNPRAELIG